MVDSLKTKGLEAALNEANAKLDALKKASAKLGDVAIDLKTSDDNIDSYHVAGEKYDEMKKAETEELESIKEDFKKEKSTYAGELMAAIIAVSTRAGFLSLELTASRAADRKAEEAKNNI